MTLFHLELLGTTNTLIIKVLGQVEGTLSERVLKQLHTHKTF